MEQQDLSGVDLSGLLSVIRQFQRSLLQIENNHTAELDTRDAKIQYLQQCLKQKETLQMKYDSVSRQKSIFEAKYMQEIKSKQIFIKNFDKLSKEKEDLSARVVRHQNEAFDTKVRYQTQLGLLRQNSLLKFRQYETQINRLNVEKYNALMRLSRSHNESNISLFKRRM